MLHSMLGMFIFKWYLCQLQERLFICKRRMHAQLSNWVWIPSTIFLLLIYSWSIQIYIILAKDWFLPMHNVPIFSIVNTNCYNYVALFMLQLMLCIIWKEKAERIKQRRKSILDSYQSIWGMHRSNFFDWSARMGFLSLLHDQYRGKVSFLCNLRGCWT